MSRKRPSSMSERTLQHLSPPASRRQSVHAPAAKPAAAPQHALQALNALADHAVCHDDAGASTAGGVATRRQKQRSAAARICSSELADSGVPGEVSRALLAVAAAEWDAGGGPVQQPSNTWRLHQHHHHQASGHDEGYEAEHDEALEAGGAGSPTASELRCALSDTQLAHLQLAHQATASTPPPIMIGTRPQQPQQAQQQLEGVFGRKTRRKQSGAGAVAVSGVSARQVRLQNPGDYVATV